MPLFDRPCPLKHPFFARLAGGMHPDYQYFKNNYIRKPVNLNIADDTFIVYKSLVLWMIA
jgi:hypothetical protein